MFGRACYKSKGKGLFKSKPVNMDKSSLKLKFEVL